MNDNNTNHKADPGKRLVAATIDFGIALAILRIPLIGGILGVAYILLKDGLDFEFMNKRSVGKKTMQLRTVSLSSDNVDIKSSIQRNWMLALIILFIYMQITGIFDSGQLLFVTIVAVVLCIIEIIFFIASDDGRRLGDRIAKTQVVNEPV